MRILVTGKNGGLAKELRSVIPEAIYNSHDYCDLTSSRDTRYLISQCKPDVVVHCAARVGGLLDNIANQYDYLHQNIAINDNVIDACILYNVPKLIAISSSCAYPEILADFMYPLKEEYIHLGPPVETNFSYGYAKRLMQIQIDAANSQKGKNYNYIICSNMYGPTDNFSNSGHFMSKLLKRMWLYKNGKIDKIAMKGSGHAYRQYTYYRDLARCLRTHIEHNINSSYNFSYPNNYKLSTIAFLAKNALSIDSDITFEESVPMGQIRKDVSIEKFRSIKEFRNFKFTSIVDGVKETFNKLGEISDKIDFEYN